MWGLAGVLICAGVSDVYVCHVRKRASAREGVGARMLSLACVHVGVGMCGHVCAYVCVHVRAAMVGPGSACRRGRVPGTAARAWHGCEHVWLSLCACVCVGMCGHVHAHVYVYVWAASMGRGLRRRRGRALGSEV
jgi:hypothetical protein